MPKGNAHRPAALQAKAIALLVQGHGPTEAAQILGIPRQKLWDWRKDDPAYRKALEDAELSLAAAIVDEGVAESLARLRGLAPKVVAAFERGLDSDVRWITVGKGVEPVPDNSLAVRAAELVAKHITEMTPIERHELTIGTLEERIAAARDTPGD